MPKRDAAPVGAPCWVDLQSSDVEKSKAFYKEILGWDADTPNDEFGGYFNFRRAGETIAGCMKKEDGAPFPDVWSVYLAVDDAEKAMEIALASGAQPIVHPMQVGDFGTMAFASDPSGAAVGLWQPETHKGFLVLGEPGAPGWFELHTRDYDKAVKFYAEVFGWDMHTMSDTADFRYSTAGEGDDAVAGIMDSSKLLPEGVPSHWLVYFAVDDTDEALKATVELGGSIVLPAEDTPFGRLAHATDSTGAHFKLVSEIK